MQPELLQSTAGPLKKMAIRTWVLLNWRPAPTNSPRQSRQAMGKGTCLAEGANDSFWMSHKECFVPATTPGSATHVWKLPRARLTGEMSCPRWTCSTTSCAGTRRTGQGVFALFSVPKLGPWQLSCWLPSHQLTRLWSKMVPKMDPANGNMDKSLRSPGGLILTHTHMELRIFLQGSVRFQVSRWEGR